MDVNDRRNRAVGEAAEWWLSLQEAPESRELRERFVDWLRESPVHVAEFLRVAQVHAALEGFRSWEGVDTAGAETPGAPIDLSSYRKEAGAAATRPAHAGLLRDEAERPSTTRRRWLVAASIAVLAAAGGGAWLATYAGAQVIETGRGERREVTLADGSALQIDPETRLRIRYKERARDVRLDKGRALFKVAKDAQRPFVVNTDHTQVQALGTVFGVEREPVGTVVTVAEGRVAVAPTASTESRPARSTTPANGTGESAAGGSATPSSARAGQVLLEAGEQVVVPRRGVADAVKKVNSERALAWAEGRLIFENETVAEVVAQFNRYNFVQLRVADPGLARRPVSGVFDASEPESFIGFIQSVAAVLVEREGSDITISSAP